jgi:hypothetical protein
VDEFREAQRHEVIDRRRPEAAPLAGVHPVGAVEDVEAPGEELDGRPRRTIPGVPPGTAGQKRENSLLERQSPDRRDDPAAAVHAGGCEDQDLIVGADRLRQARKQAAEKVADTRARMGEGGDVDDDSHGAILPASVRRARVSCSP